MPLSALPIAILAALLGLTTREWLGLRARQRQRGLFRRWPIRKVQGRKEYLAFLIPAAIWKHHYGPPELRMGRQELALLIPLFALAIPVAAVILNGMHRIAKLRLEEARLRLGGGGADSGEVHALRSEIESMRGELTELQERVDFTERMLANPNRLTDTQRGGSPQGGES